MSDWGWYPKAMTEDRKTPGKTRQLSRRDILLASAAMVFAGAGEVQAQRRQQRRRRRQALRRGEVKPLFQLMRTFQAQVDGEVLDVRYRERGQARAYIFVILSPDGRIDRYVMDADTEQIFTLAEARKHYGISRRR